MYRLLHWVLIGLLSIGLLGATDLVWKELQTGNGCPKILTIPACIIVFICFLIPLLSQLFKKWKYLYFIFTSLGFLIATIASYMQLIGSAECPVIEDIPLCYISFLIFTSLILIKILSLNKIYYKSNDYKKN